ncbi:MAG TPA: hypothetical protein VHM25_11875 [Polyangiaceae bacterium]|jgi:methyl-accepting chemotaxis protein|nr:hypothetical protein [Polyangiaceae bacterium]
MANKHSSIKQIAVGLSLVSVCAVAIPSGGARAAESSKPAAAPQPNPVPVKADSGDLFETISEESRLTAQDREVLGWARELSAECGQVLEKWISSGAVSEDRLFARLYYPQPNTDPTKYTTDYDALADRDIGPIQERYLTKTEMLSYVIVTDLNAYVPTHNQRYAQPLTGNLAVDLVNNRTKRIFMTTVGFRAARNEASVLVQSYERDNGERVLDLSVPLSVRGKHFGSVRFGYRPIQK